MNHYKVPGLRVAVYRNGELEWAKGYGLDYLHDHPIMELENEVIRISISNIQAEDLAQIFLAAGIAYRLGVAFEVQFPCK